MYTFDLEGTFKVLSPPASPKPSGDFVFRADISEQFLGASKDDKVVHLSADGPVAMDLSQMPSGANVVFVRVLTSGAGTVLATFTHAGGTSQVIPVDPVLVLFCASSPITALSIARSPGVSTDVQVMMGAT